MKEKENSFRDWHFNLESSVSHKWCQLEMQYTENDYRNTPSKVPKNFFTL